MIFSSLKNRFRSRTRVASFKFQNALDLKNSIFFESGLRMARTDKCACSGSMSKEPALAKPRSVDRVIQSHVDPGSRFRRQGPSFRGAVYTNS